VPAGRRLVGWGTAGFGTAAYLTCFAMSALLAVAAALVAGWVRGHTDGSPGTSGVRAQQTPTTSSAANAGRSGSLTYLR